MSHPFKSIVSESSDISLEIIYQDDKQNKEEKFADCFPKTTTIEEIVRRFLTEIQQEHIPLDQIQLIRISHSNRPLPFPREYLHQNLIQLKVEDDSILHLHRPNWVLPVEILQLSIWGPRQTRETWPWDKNSATLPMLLEYVIEVFALKDVERSRIHLFSQNEELNLSLHPETLLTQIGIDSYSSVDVQIIPPLSSVSHVFDDDLVVKCVYADHPEFTLKLSWLDSPRDLERRIQGRLGKSRLSSIELFDANDQRVHITDWTTSLGMLGIKPADRIVARLQVDSSSSTFNDQTEDKRVDVFFSPMTYPSIHFQISINQTMRHLIEKIKDSVEPQPSHVFRIRSGLKDIDQTKPDERLIDLGVNGNSPLHVTITYRSSFATWTDNPLYSSTTTTTTTSLSVSSLKPVGLSNMGNTCFMNSALQCLAHAKPLTDFFLNSVIQSNPDENHFDVDRSLTHAYADLLKQIWSKSTDSSSSFFWNSFKPERIKEIIGNLELRFASYEQQDAQEFMTFFLEQLHKEFKQSDDDGDSKTIIKELFYGKIQSIITCLKCHHQMVTTNSSSLLSLPLNEYERIFSIKFVGRDQFNDETIVPIKSTSLVKHLIRDFEKRSPTKFYREIIVLANDELVSYETPLNEISTDELVLVEQDRYGGLSHSSYLDDRRAKIQLEKCLETFFSEEHLDVPIECEEHCHDRTAGKKQLQLESLPPILIIQLKRFSHENGHREKIETFVEYPVEGLDLNRFVQSRSEGENYIYDLFAVSNHSGLINFGHYTAFTRRETRWYKCDDSCVSSVINRDDIVCREAYLLFYIRREAKEATSE